MIFQFFNIYNVYFTCIVYTRTFVGMSETSNRNHEVRSISWFNALRTAEWTMWYKNKEITMYLILVWMTRIYPAFVKYPVSGSLVGSSSHVKQSVRLSRCSVWGLQ